MKSVALPRYYVAALCFCSGIILANATTILIDGTNSNVMFNASDGIGGTVASIIDGTVSDAQSSFSKEIITVGDSATPIVSDAVQISTIPVVSSGGSNHFRLLYDAQETGGTGNHQITINDLRFYVDSSNSANVPAAGTLVWDLGTDELSVNPTDDGTDTPQGNGADFALLLPVSAFAGLNTDSYLYLQTRQTNSDNGNDEWVLGTGNTLPPATVITPTTNPIPEPSTAVLSGLAVLLLLGRRRRD